MFEHLESYLLTLVVFTTAILAILNPFGNLPQFLAMTEGLQAPLRQKIFRTIILTAFIIVITFIVTGPFIMEDLFKIKIADLRIAGGLILVVMGIKNLLFPYGTGQEHIECGSQETEDDVLKKSILPMAFPMLVGPGTLSTVIILSSDKGMPITICAALLAFASMAVLFHFAATIERIIGKLILHVIARIMQVFIVAIGVKMVATGVYEVLKLPMP